MKKIEIKIILNMFEEYKYLSYNQMRQNLKDLAAKYPETMRLSNAEEEFNLKHHVSCDINRCQVDIVYLSNVAVPKN